MRKSADILSSAPAMQIRYLETMQAMAKSAGAKVIFLPAPNQSMKPVMESVDDNGGEGSSGGVPTYFNGEDKDGFQTAMNARMVENI